LSVDRRIRDYFWPALVEKAYLRFSVAMTSQEAIQAQIYPYSIVVYRNKYSYMTGVEPDRLWKSSKISRMVTCVVTIVTGQLPH